MRICGLDVKFSILLDACLPVDIDKESEVMTLSLSSSVGFEEAMAFLEISDCKDYFSHDEVEDDSIINVLHKSKQFEEAQANKL